MIEDALEMNAGQEPGLPGCEELASANDVMASMVKTAKGLRIYLPNNAVLIKFVEELHARMAGHIARFGGFRLQVEPFALTYKGTDLYENQDPKESMAFRIHCDGIRVLLFSQGVEQQELAAFLGIVGLERPARQDDDIVTRLWEENLPHINYLLQDDFDEVDSEEEAAFVSQQDAVRRILAGVAGELPHPPRMVPKHLLMLTGEEAQWLRKARQAEALRNPLDDVINILSAILAGAKKPDTFRDFLGIVGELTVSMLMAGEFGHALRLVRFLDQLLNLGSVPDQKRQQVAATISGLLSEKTLQVLQETLDTGDSVTHEDLREILQIFGLPSLGEICELLGRVEKLKTRKVIIEVLVELGRDNPRVFVPFLSDARWYLVRNVVLVLSLLESPVALEMIAGLISHKEMRIRKEVLGFLERSPDPKARSYILKFLRDESSALRIRALQILARERQPFALRAALALTTADDFRSKGTAEKKAVYEAIGELGSERMIPLFRDMLLKRSWFKKAVDKESAICAVAGLAKIRSAAAVQLLQEAYQQQNAEIRGIISQAISSRALAPAAEEQRSIPGGGR